MLQGMAGVDQVAPFGLTLHVVGPDKAKRLLAIGYQRGRANRVNSRHRRPAWRMCSSSSWAVDGQHGMNRLFSLRRLLAIITKEAIQMRRDRITFAMMLGVPLMQLVLFGFAINNDPKGLPAALVTTSQDHYTRAMVSAMENTGYYRFDHVVASARKPTG
jgi:hypothetical protein